MTVSRDRQSSRSIRAAAAFSTVLTREQIAALPDDPDEMAAAPESDVAAGRDASRRRIHRRRLPPKSQIRSIRLPRLDMFAAQNHGGMSGVMLHRHHDDARQRPDEGRHGLQLSG